MNLKQADKHLFRNFFVGKTQSAPNQRLVASHEHRFDAVLFKRVELFVGSLLVPDLEPEANDLDQPVVFDVDRSAHHEILEENEIELNKRKEKKRKEKKRKEKN